MSASAVVAWYSGRHTSSGDGKDESGRLNRIMLVGMILSLIAAYGAWLHPISPNEPQPQPSSGSSDMSSQSSASQAVDFALSQIGSPYVYGGAGPYEDGYDCSGLMMAAWASAGVSIPRDSYEQWAELPHVKMSDLQPGDLLFYNGFGHVAMYVGHNEIIDAPQIGQDVTIIPMSTPWYAQSYDGAVQP
jgi:peptidoglycan DL-endopeptidase CwlO